MTVRVLERPYRTGKHLSPRCYLGGTDWNAGCDDPRHMLPGAPKFGFGVLGSRTRVQDWKSSSLSRVMTCERTIGEGASQAKLDEGRLATCVNLRCVRFRWWLAV